MSRRDAARGSPIDAQALDRLAISYVGRYGTTAAKLATYLRRKVREHGWADEGSPPIEAVVTRCERLGFVDDEAFARARGEAFLRRGLGARRIQASLRAAGVSAEVAAPVEEAAREAGWDAALAFARRRRIGPFAQREADPDRRRRDLAAMMRAGHSLTMAKRIVFAEPGQEIEEQAIDD